MTDKQVIIDDCPYQGECSISGCKRNDDGCFVIQLFEERGRAEKQIIELNKTIQAKQQECERLEETNNTLTVTREKLLGDLCIVEESLKDYTEHYNRQSEEVDQLKTENEKLKKELSTYGATGICETCTEKSVLKCDQLEVENEELKKWKKEHLKDVEFIERNPVIDILNSMADNILLEQRNEKLKQTLTEIKEIAKGVRSYLNYPSPKDVRYEMDIILQKISEVEND